MTSRSTEVLQGLFESAAVVELSDIRVALGNASRATAFRQLQHVLDRRSHSHNARYLVRV